MQSEFRLTDILDDVIDFEGQIAIRPTGTSMGARFADVEVLVIQRPSHKAIPAGTLVAFLRRDQWIVHRVIGRQFSAGGWQYKTQGDGMRWPDRGWVRHCRVKGVAVAMRVKGKRIDLCSRRARIKARLLAWRSVVATHLKRLCARGSNR